MKIHYEQTLDGMRQAAAVENKAMRDKFGSTTAFWVGGKKCQTSKPQDYKLPLPDIPPKTLGDDKRMGSKIERQLVAFKLHGITRKAAAEIMDMPLEELDKKLVRYNVVLN
tara:strand:+ start:2757 stop:3089 length:333 start_codon:yes stop_codon:yes gene_type:complete